MTDKEKQQIDDWFDSYSKEELQKKWNKYNYLSKPKKAFSLYGVVSMYKIIMAIIIFICLRLLFAIAIGEKCIGC